MRKKKIIFLVGPTAVGKSEAAVYLAKKINAEIISLDSMQIYKGMDIITSKPRETLLKRIKHYLIGVVLPSKEYNVSEYRKASLKIIEEVTDKGKIPLFVGGTGLYMSVLIDGIFELKSPSGKIRDHLYKIAKNKGSAYLYRKLVKVDPSAAKKIHPNDLRRIIRALEVFKSTGKQISQLQQLRHGLGDQYDIKVFCLQLDKIMLYKRIDSRVERMFRQGLLKEVKGLLKKQLSKTASSAIGIKEINGLFDNQYDLDKAKSLIKQNTRRYAKRQLTWFRKDIRIEWVSVKDKETPKQVAMRIYRTLSKN